MADFEKRRVSLVGVRGDMTTNQHLLQLITTSMLVRPLPPEVDGGPPVYEGPVFATWANVAHMYPGLLDDLTCYGALAALLPGHSGRHAFVPPYAQGVLHVGIDELTAECFVIALRNPER
jgi:hypothetical protein